MRSASTFLPWWGGSPNTGSPAVGRFCAIHREQPDVPRGPPLLSARANRRRTQTAGEPRGPWRASIAMTASGTGSRGARHPELRRGAAGSTRSEVAKQRSRIRPFGPHQVGSPHGLMEKKADGAGQTGAGSGVAATGAPGGTTPRSSSAALITTSSPAGKLLNTAELVLLLGRF